MGGSQKVTSSTMRWALIIGIVLMLVKFGAYLLTHSNAILTDAAESIVNVLAGAFASWSLAYSSKPKDEDHPYGHGKIEFFSSGVEGGMIVIAGLVMVVKGIYSFFHPNLLVHLDWGIGLTVISGFANWFLAKRLIKIGTEQHSTILIADGKHLLTDTWSSVGLIVSLSLIYITGWLWIDVVVTIVLGVIILYTGFVLIRDSVFNLLDKTDYQKIEHLISFLNSKRKPQWVDIHNLRVVKYGALVHVDCHMTLPWYYSLEQAHAEVDVLAKLAREQLNYEIEFFIHADPCLPKSCEICQLLECPERKFNQIKKLNWTMANVLPDSKHSASA